MRYQLTFVKTAIIQNSTDIKYWQGCGKTGTLEHVWWNLISAVNIENWMKVPHKINNSTTIWSSNFTPGIYPKKTQTLILKPTWTPTFTVALFPIAKIWKQFMCPILQTNWEKRSVCICSHKHTCTQWNIPQQ